MILTTLCYAFDNQIINIFLYFVRTILLFLCKYIYNDSNWYDMEFVIDMFITILNIINKLTKPFSSHLSPVRAPQ